MARSSADDMELRRACQIAVDVSSPGSRHKVVLSMRVAKSRGIWGKSGKLGRQMAKPRVLALTTKEKGQRTKALLRVLKYSTGGVLEPAKLYKLKHLSKVELIQNDPSGCTFTLGFDNLRSQTVAPPQWTMRNKDDRNRFLLCILNLFKEIVGRLPKVVGIDVVEMAIWAKENTPAVAKQVSTEDGPIDTAITENDSAVTVEKDLVSQAEEEDMEALLGTYVMGIGEAEAFSERLKREFLALEAANVHALLESEPLIEEVLRRLEDATVCVDDIDEWLGIFNVKLRHMREDIESIESRNNTLELQTANNKLLTEELDRLLERLHIPSEIADCLTDGSFGEAHMLKNIEACEWLSSAIHGLEAENFDQRYTNMRADMWHFATELVVNFATQAAPHLLYLSCVTEHISSDAFLFLVSRNSVSDYITSCLSCQGIISWKDHHKPFVKEKRAELKILKSTFIRRASEFLRNYFASLVDMVLSDKNNFSQRGQLKRPDHADLRFNCRTYARLLQHLKSLDKSCMGLLRKAYCHSLNLLFRREAREFANELRANTKVPRNPSVSLDAPAGANQTTSSSDTSGISEVYSKMLTVFIPLLVDESSFFAHFMCFEVPSPGNETNEKNQNHTYANDAKINNTSDDFGALNEALQELLDGMQEDFLAVIDWACKIDPLCCISMHGTTERYLSGQKADTAGFVRQLLGELESRISVMFSRYIDEACHQIEKNERAVRQMGVLPYITRFAALATRMEQYIQGQSRDLVDQAYTKLVSIMFVTLEKIAQTDPKYADIVLFENYAAFQNSLYDLANVVPILAKFYHQASESYEQACTRHINMVIYIHFEKLFQFARRIEECFQSSTAEEIPFLLGLSKMDLRKTLKTSFSGLDKSANAMYKKLQKNVTSEELMPSLWEKCKKEFLDKYDAFVRLVEKVYPKETIPTVAEIRELLAPL